MRHPVLIALCLAGTASLAACGGRNSDAEVDRALKSVNVIDESNLNDIMLTVGAPDEAVNYFRGASAKAPDRVDLKRGLAKSLVRATRHAEAIVIWSEIVGSSGATNDDRVNYAESLIRANEWKRAEAELNKIPPTHETYERYRLEAMVADSNKNWKKADSFYEIAAGLTSTPAGVFNNWGFSKLTRGDGPGAEKLFLQALTYDSTMFTAKNNLVMSRALQRKYELPVIAMTQDEKAKLLYTAGLSAVKQGDTTTGKRLLQEAVDTAPTYFEEAARSLAALEGR